MVLKRLGYIGNRLEIGLRPHEADLDKLTQHDHNITKVLAINLEAYI